MKFKSLRVQDEYDSQAIWPLLKEILRDADDYAVELGCPDLVITSIVRTAQEDLALHGSGIHCTGRAADIRIPCWDDPRSLVLARYLCNKYIYDPARPQLKVAFMEPHGDGPHIHVQVHARTRLR